MGNRKNDHLINAAKAKKDEFYTQLADIERELKYYRKHFKDKTVFCNCDDPFESTFSNSLNKRMLAAEKYASGLKKENFNLDDAAGIRRRAEEAQQSHAEAIRLLQELEAELGI